MRRLHALAAAALGTVAGSTVVVAPAQATDPTPVFAFTSDRDGDPDIYVRRADGSTVKLTRNRVADFDAVWSPDGSRFVFVRAVGAGSALFVMDADGTDVRRLTTPVRTPEGLRSMDLAPAWSPDGRRVAFVSNRTGGEGEVFRIDADGSGLRRLTRTAAHVSDHNPTWSPDGRWIWFDSDRPGYMNREIYRMRPDGSSVQRITRTADGVDDGAPDISPDGRRVVFSSTRGNGDQDLWTMRPGGTDARRLGTGAEIRDEVFPQWTAGGETVLYWQFGSPDEPRDTIRLIDADGTGDRPLTSGRANDFSPDPYPLPRG